MQETPVPPHFLIALDRMTRDEEGKKLCSRMTSFSFFMSVTPSFSPLDSQSPRMVFMQSVLVLLHSAFHPNPLLPSPLISMPVPSMSSIVFDSRSPNAHCLQQMPTRPPLIKLKRNDGKEKPSQQLSSILCNRRRSRNGKPTALPSFSPTRCNLIPSSSISSSSILSTTTPCFLYSATVSRNAIISAESIIDCMPPPPSSKSEHTRDPLKILRSIIPPPPSATLAPIPTCSNSFRDKNGWPRRKHKTPVNDPKNLFAVTTPPPPPANTMEALSL
mmetsp:Transcript_43624/g.113669  ORF Transcript_43624/g.113669 Transcript_43624/m.113669 type:complete len:274 (-) Transcript_43624:357-1178(-)